MTRSTVRETKGFAMIFVLSIVLLVVLMGGAYIFVGVNDLRAAEMRTNAERAFYLADAGIAQKFMDLRSGDTSSLGFPTPVTFTFATGMTGTYQVNVLTQHLTPFAEYTLQSIGTYKNVTRHIDLTIEAMPFTRFAYLSNSENHMYHHAKSPIWFTTQDLLRGPIHTNDQLNISGNPVFEGPVSSVSTTINYYHGGPPADDPDFEDTLTLGASPIQMPTTASLVNNVKSAAQQSTGLYLTGDTQIALLSNGTMNVTNGNQNPKWTNKNMSLPQNKVVFVSNGDVKISGIMNGVLTVGTDNDIYAVGSIMYNSDPRTNPSSTDMLGLISQNNIYVSSNAPYNVEIDAYIMAVNGSFSVQNYDQNLNGTLTVYGGMTQEIRGAVGTFDPRDNDKVTGYTKDYSYDVRLLTAAPPCFPVTKDSNGKILYNKITWVEH